MWYYVIDGFVYAYAAGSMAGNTGWFYSDDVIAEPLEDDNTGDPLYRLADGHVVPVN